VLASNCNHPLVLTMPLGSALSGDVNRPLSITAVVSIAPNCVVAPRLRFRWNLTSPAWDPMAAPSIAAAFNRSVATVSLPPAAYVVVRPGTGT